MSEAVKKPASPYRGNPPETYWRTGVTGRPADGLENLYRKKFELSPGDRIATAGSCFAQHIARHLRRNGYTVVDTEPAPPLIDESTAQEFGYGIYSARFGNIYYVRQLLQLVQEALGEFEPQDAVWERNGRYYDALRPSVEPEGLETPGLVALHRGRHLAAVKRMIERADVLVYTFGLTEGWEHRPSGTVYPTAPGTIAGSYDPDVHAFRNFTYPEIMADFLAFRELAHRIQPGLRFLLTVSPVALAATATGGHVLTATSYSKAVLRAVAGDLAAAHDDIDYFPSYEIITSQVSGGRFFDDTLRGVTDEGVRTVMGYFFAEHAPGGSAPAAGAPAAGTAPAAPAAPAAVPATPAPVATASAATAENEEAGETVFCEEALLEAFSKE